jgi:hypothetical protein
MSQTRLNLKKQSSKAPLWQALRMTLLSLILGTLLVMQCGLIPSQAADWSQYVQNAILTASDGGASYAFGSTIAVDGDTAVIGAPGGNGGGGAAYVFVRSGSVWSQQAILVPGINDPCDGFGKAVAINGDIAVVGAPFTANGKVIIFTRSGTLWSKADVLTQSDPTGADQFGSALAFDGATIVIGASQNSDYGAAYIYTQSGPNWTPKAKLLPSNIIDDDFGSAAAIDGGTVAIGANYKSGAVYVFTGSGASWSLQTRLAPAVVETQSMGTSLALAGDTLVCGLNGTNGFAGAVQVFTRSGVNWSLQSELVPEDLISQDYFGFAVDLDGNTLIAGAPGQNSGTGAVYIYDLNGSTWTPGAKLIDTEGTAGDLFGAAVFIDGTGALVGAFGVEGATGSVYQFSPGEKQRPVLAAGGEVSNINLFSIAAPWLVLTSGLIAAGLWWITRRRNT